jgi:hypothetical protein
MAVFVILNAMGQCFLIGPIMLIPCFVNAASNTTPPRLCFYAATCWPFDILAELKYHLFTVVFSPCSSIDNGPIQCEHGKVPASKVTSMKRLSSVAWEKLYSKVRNPTSWFALH